MKSLILFPTDTSQWYNLILEAESKTQIHLHVDTESYLVFLLMRSSRSTIWLDSLVGQELLQALQHKGQKQKQMLVEIGDKSLLFSGMFPGHAEKKKIDPMYFVTIGQIAYASVGSFPDEPKYKLFHDLSENFQSLSKLLLTVRDIFINQP